MDQEMTFEQAKDQIEEIIRKMENGNLPLEESVTQFEEAVGLIRFCQKKLDGYQKKIETISLETDDENHE